MSECHWNGHRSSHYVAFGHYGVGRRGHFLVLSMLHSLAISYRADCLCIRLVLQNLKGSPLDYKSQVFYIQPSSLDPRRWLILRKEGADLLAVDTCVDAWTVAVWLLLLIS